MEQIDNVQKKLILLRLEAARKERDNCDVLSSEFTRLCGECEALSYVCGVLGLCNDVEEGKDSEQV